MGTVEPYALLLFYWYGVFIGALVLAWGIAIALMIKSTIICNCELTDWKEIQIMDVVHLTVNSLVLCGIIVQAP